MHQFCCTALLLLLEELYVCEVEDGSASSSEPEQFAIAKKARLANMEHKAFMGEKRGLIS
jgi:hypothetical protein